MRVLSVVCLVAALCTVVICENGQNATLSRVKRSRKLAIFYTKGSDEGDSKSESEEVAKKKNSSEDKQCSCSFDKCCCGKIGKDKSTVIDRFMNVMESVIRPVKSSKSKDESSDESKSRKSLDSSEENVSADWEDHIWRDTKWPESSEELIHYPGRGHKKCPKTIVVVREEEKKPANKSKNNDHKEDKNKKPDGEKKPNRRRKGPKSFFDGPDSDESREKKEDPETGKNNRRQTFEEYYQKRRNDEIASHLKEYYSSKN